MKIELHAPTSFPTPADSTTIPTVVSKVLASSSVYLEANEEEEETKTNIGD